MIRARLALIRNYITGLILEGEFRDGDLLPSVRALATELRVNPLTVAKAYNPFVEQGVIEARRGMGTVIRKGGIRRLRHIETERFCHEEWPTIVADIKRLQLTKTERLAEAEAERGG